MCVSETVCFHRVASKACSGVSEVSGNELMINVQVTCGSLIGHWGWRSFVNDAPAAFAFQDIGIEENEIT